MFVLLGKTVAGLGCLILVSASVVNPWIGTVYRDWIDNFYDVMLSYFYWSLGLGVLLVVTGWIVAQRQKEFWARAALLIATVSLILLVDRAMLAIWGLPYWIPDPILGYRHRPNTVRVWGSSVMPTWDTRIQGARISINRHGHHDDDFPIAKPQGQLRGLMLGDSVVMGHGLDKENTVANLLEGILNAYDGQFVSHQIINAGVEGYSTAREYHVFKKSLIFQPDFVAVGLCMNDISDPLVQDRKLGGVGHFWGMIKTGNVLTGYLLNETGFGRLIIKLCAPAISLKERQLASVYNVQEMVVRSPEDPEFRAGWKLVLNNLEAMYQLAGEREIPIVLLVYPFTFQLFNEEMKEPQKLLLEHARRYGVDAIDLTGVFENSIRADIEHILGTKQKESLQLEDLQLLYSFQSKRYFLDLDHPTQFGNQLVAMRLAEYLARRRIVELNLHRFKREQTDVLRDRSSEFIFPDPNGV